MSPVTLGTKAGGRFGALRREDRDSEMTEAVGFIVDRYRKLWRDYSHSIRITSVEALHDKHLWEQVKDFIEEFGAEFFHTPMLMVSNIRSILHVGADSFLDYLAEESDPLHPNALIEAIEDGDIEREAACQYLELIYECILEKLESFIEYNTTTTYSDYGDQLYCLLDFLRAEAAYDRDAWLLKPFRIAHEVLMETGNANAAALWEKQLRDTTQTKARKHLRKLSRLEKTYGIRLPSLSDHLDEQFVKTFAVDRMVALIPRALEELRRPGKAAVSFEALRTEIDRYLESTSGSAIEIPEWLTRLAREVQRHEPGRPFPDDGEIDSLGDNAPVVLRPRQLARRIDRWNRKRH